MSESEFDENSACQTSSPQSLRHTSIPVIHNDDNHSHILSSQGYDPSADDTTSNDEAELHLDHEHGIPRPPFTRQSSVSSFPASVIHHTPSYLDRQPRTPSKSAYDYEHVHNTTPTYHSPRAYSTGFRHPSSVRALQMRDEFDTDFEELTPNRRREARMSQFSHRSSGSSVNSSPSRRLKRSVQSPSQKPGNKSKLRNEFPLVLLHCTLLTSAISSQAPHLSDSILEAIIPQPYGRRWKLLQDKVMRNSEVRTRGILIPHPRDEYEMLEEKLLENLELQRPRLRDGHFLGTGENNAVDSGFESASSSDKTADEIGDDTEDAMQNACPDCGRCVTQATEAERRWEIKVFAANGLLRGSAWSAVWQEMEKVDVEIGVWMPEEVRREVDTRLEALLEQEKTEKKAKRRERKRMDDERMREIYGSEVPTPVDGVKVRTQDEIDGLYDQHETDTRKQQRSGSHSHPGFDGIQSRSRTETFSPQTSKANPELQDIIVNYITLLLQDRRNIAIVLLSMLVLFYGVTNPQPSRINEAGANETSHNALQIPEIELRVITSTVFSTSTTIATKTSTASNMKETRSETPQGKQLEAMIHTIPLVPDLIPEQDGENDTSVKDQIKAGQEYLSTSSVAWETIQEGSFSQTCPVKDLFRWPVSNVHQNTLS